MDPYKIYLVYTGLLTLLLAFLMMDKRQQVLFLAATCLFGAASGVSLKVGNFKLDLGGGGGGKAFTSDVGQVEDASTGTVIFDVKEFEADGNEVLQTVEGEYDALDCNCAKVEVVEKVVSTCDVALAQQVVSVENEKLALDAKYKEFLAEYISTLDQLAKINVLADMQRTILFKMPTYYQGKLNALKAELVESNLKHESEVSSITLAFKEQKKEMMKRHTDKEKRASDYVKNRETFLLNEIKLSEEKYEQMLQDKDDIHQEELFKRRQVIYDTKAKYEDILSKNEIDHDDRVKSLENQIDIEKKEHNFEISRLQKEFSEKLEKESNYNTNKITSLIEKFEAEKAALKDSYEDKISEIDYDYASEETRKEEQYQRERSMYEDEVMDLVKKLNETEIMWQEKLISNSKFWSESMKENGDLLRNKYDAIITDYKDDLSSLQDELRVSESDLKCCYEDLVYFQQLHASQHFCNSTLIRLHVENELGRFRAIIVDSFEMISTKCAEVSSEIKNSATNIMKPVLRSFVEVMMEKYNQLVYPHVQEVSTKVAPYFQRGLILASSHVEKVQIVLNPVLHQLRLLLSPYTNNNISETYLVAPIGFFILWMLFRQQWKKNVKERSGSKKNAQMNENSFSHMSGLDGWTETNATENVSEHEQ